MPLRRILRSRPASFYRPAPIKQAQCLVLYVSIIQRTRSAVVDGAHEILAAGGVCAILCSCCLVLCTYIQHTLRASLDPTSKNAPRRAGLFLLCASQLNRQSRVGFVPFFPRYVSHTCSQASWSKVRSLRWDAKKYVSVRLASRSCLVRTRFGVAHAHGICTTRLFEMKRWRAWKLPARFSSATTSASTSLNLAQVGVEVVLLAPPAFPNDMPVTGHAPPNPKKRKRRHHRQRHDPSTRLSDIRDAVVSMFHCARQLLPQHAWR